jgi:hypothetical protein
MMFKLYEKNFCLAGSKKSGPIRMMKEASEQVESLIGVPIVQSSINSSATMESVCVELQARPHLLQVQSTIALVNKIKRFHFQLWDELAIFLGIFGSTRSDRASYDRGIMCELYSPTGIVRRQLVTRTNIMVKPRLCVLAAGHPRETINCLTGKVIPNKKNSFDYLHSFFTDIRVRLKKCFNRHIFKLKKICLIGSGPKTTECNDDGLFNRFLVAVAFKRTPIRDCAPPDNTIPKLSHLFFYTKLLHKDEQEYKFNNEGTNGKNVLSNK